jgi:hypothetical protein
MAELTESQVRAIAKEEAMKVQGEVLKELSEVRETLSRLERLLLGEIGSDQEDTLKARANFAFLYARRNTDAKIIERATPAIKWFEDMAEVEPGCKESKLDSLGKMISFYLNIRWLLGLIGVTTIVNAIPIITNIVEWISRLSN